MRPGPRLPPALLALGLAALLVPLAGGLVYPLLAALLALLGASAAEALLLARVRLAVDRPAVSVLSLGEPDTLECRLRSDARRPLHLELRQVFPSLLDGGSATRRALLRPGESLALSLPVRGVARGREALPPLHAALGFFGLAERVVAAGAPAGLVVLPDLRAVAALHAKLNRFVLRGLGSRTSARLGKGREFDRLRDYVQGDDARDVAWKATARRGRLTVREYRLDRSQDVLVCLDRGHRMAARAAGLSRLDHAVNAALVLAYIANRMEDRTALVAFATDVEAGVPAGRGGIHLRRFTDFAARVRGGYLHSDYLALAADLRRRLRHRTLVAILTALPEIETEPLLRGLRMLAPQHLPLVVVLEDPDLRAAAELRPAGRAELGRVLAARDLRQARQQTIRDARSLGALVVEAAPGEAGTAAMNAYIDVKRRQLL